MKKIVLMLFLFLQIAWGATMRAYGQEACFLAPGESQCPYHPNSPSADPAYQAERVRREEEIWFPKSLLGSLQSYHHAYGSLLQDVAHEDPLKARSAAARARGLQELLDIVHALQSTIDTAEGPSATFFVSLQPKFKQLADQNKMDADHLEAQFRTDRFGWPDTQRAFHDQLKNLLFKEKWIEANWGPAFARPDLVTAFLSGSGSKRLRDHYAFLATRIQGMLNQFNSVPYVSIGSMPALLYVPIKNSIFVWPTDEANVPIPANPLDPRVNQNGISAWPSEEANGPVPANPVTPRVNGVLPERLPHMPFGMTGSERILLSTLDRQYQIKIQILDLSIVNLNFPTCEAEVSATIADMMNIDREILLRSEYYKASKRGPQIAAAREMMKKAIPEANSLKNSTARLSSLLATLSQTRLVSPNSFEAWQKAIKEDFSKLPQSLRDEATGLSDLMQAAQWMGEFSMEPSDDGLWRYEEPLVGLTSPLKDLMERASNQEDPSALADLATQLQAEVNLAAQQLEFEVQRLSQSDPSEGPDNGPHLTDEQIDTQITALGLHTGQLKNKCLGTPVTVLPQ